MLYPTLEIDRNQRQIELPSGVLGFVPLTLAQSSEITITLMQLIPHPQNLPQDRSLRVWFSDKLGGRSLLEANPALAFTHLSALSPAVLRLYDENVIVNEYGIRAPATPGQYWLNVLNLVNEANSFSLDIS